MSNVETPLMKQYNSIKAKHPDAILLFRVGDFYETFSDDALKASKVLGIVCTFRNNGNVPVELAGFPYHALDNYLPKLVRAGYRVAICEQLEDPKMTKTIVKRGVTEMVTPGVTVNDKILQHKNNNYLCAIHFDKKNAGIAFIDVSTGEFICSEGDLNYIEKLVQNFQPKEVLFSKKNQKIYTEFFGNNYHTFALDDWNFDFEYNYEKLKNHFQTNTLKGFGIEELKMAQIASGACLHYISSTELLNLQHIQSIQKIEDENIVWLDRFTIRNLELLHSLQPEGVSLLEVLDKTLTPMGSRMLQRWIVMPLKPIHLIRERLNAVDYFYKSEAIHKIELQLKRTGDIERLVSKIPLMKINPRELLQLSLALQTINPIKKVLESSDDEALQKLNAHLQPLDFVCKKIEETIEDNAPVLLQKGQVIRSGVNTDLDELRNIITNGKDYIVAIQNREIENTGISSLKIGFNNVFGYYLEVRNTHKEKVPENWIRKQTLTGAERYITPELKSLEEKMLSAEEKISNLENKIYTELVQSLIEYIEAIQRNAKALANIDCIQSLANVAKQNKYVKPAVDDSLCIDIKNGRHPVIEKALPLGETYVANDVMLDNELQQIIILTGPNMSGKSALLRQTALIVLMAQIGSFVPAETANIGWVDKIFTRVGASDSLSSGESTFMVEMNETASIINNITERSLILLDEIGRGTSTYDGISIAWSLTEYLHNNAKAHPKTFFATHYHELNELSEKFSRIKNYHIATHETKEKVIFLRKMLPGGSEHSFGIHVAKMAGMPKEIIQKAEFVLNELEKQRGNSEEIKQSLKKVPKSDYQLSIFNLDDPKLLQIKEMLSDIDINTLTPVEALIKLNEIKRLSE